MANPTGESQTDPRPAPSLADDASPESPPWLIDCQSHRLQPETLDGAIALRKPCASAHRPQLRRKPHAADRHRSEKLAVRREFARGTTGGGRHDPDGHLE